MWNKNAGIKVLEKKKKNAITYSNVNAMGEKFGSKSKKV